METLLIDCTSGASKERLLGDLFAMLDVSGQKVFLDRLGHICAGCDSVEYDGVKLRINGLTEGEFKKTQTQAQTQAHAHHSLDEVRSTIKSLNISEKVKQDAFAIYDILAQAEAQAHKTSIKDVHFHEVGNIYAIMHIALICAIIEQLNPSHIAATPITTGYGYINCAHGRLAIPAPATANIIDGLPTIKGNTEGELTTPTGAAIVKYFAWRFV